MKKLDPRTTRRNFVKGTAAVAGLGALSATPLRYARGQDVFPAQNLTITIPTREGGGADRDVRNFIEVWKKHLDTNFELEFFPGAAGQVGYELYVGKKEPDCHNLLFGNMGPEVIMQALQKPKATLGRDFVYFMRISSEVMSIFVGKDAPIKTLEGLVEEGRKRTINIAVSRLPHPASIGVLALGEATGADFRLVPFGGGGPTTRAALSNEVDAAALPIANPIRSGSDVDIIGVFADANPVPEDADNAPTVNEVFGTSIPVLASSRAFGIHTACIEQFPERFEILRSSMEAAIKDPAYAAQIESSGIPTAFIDYGDQDAAMAFAGSMLDLAAQYEPLLTGN